ncbi:MAG: hypothetical protein ACRD38_11105 [Nitrososphaerales archaeon]
MSYRIDTKILEEIIREASLKEISANILVNQILRKFVEFDRYQLRLGILPVPKQLLMDMMDGCDDRKIKYFAERMFRILKDSVIFTQKEQDLGAFLQVLEKYVKVAGIASDHTINGNKHVFVVQHDMGLKWSEFTRELLRIMFEKLADRAADFELTESGVIATAELPDVVH